MKKYLGPMSTLLTVICSMAAADSGSLPVLIWNSHLVPGVACDSAVLRDSGFRVATSKSSPGSDLTLMASNGPLLLNASSLVRLSSTDSVAGPRSVEVVGVNIDGALRKSKPAIRGSLGILGDDSLASLEDFVIELAPGSPLTNITNGVAAVGSFLQIALDGQNFIALHCSNGRSKATDYVAFDVFSANKRSPIARLGISLADTSILQAVRVESPQDAEKRAQILSGNGSAKTDMAFATSTVPDSAPNMSTDSTPVAAPIQNTSNRNSNQNLALAPTPPPRPTTTSPGNAAVSGLPNVPVVTGALSYSVCSKQDNIIVRDASLKKILFLARGGEAVKPVQGFGASGLKQAVIQGQRLNFEQVQFPNRRSGTNQGWMAQEFVKTASQCGGSGVLAAPAPAPEIVATQGSVETGGSFAKATRLEDPSCCNFPISHRPYASYKDGALRFRAPRFGRLHAATDIYGSTGDRINAVISGRVIRSLYYFYEGVYALEVQDVGGSVIRYGEVLGKLPQGVVPGAALQQGQQVAYMGKTTCCTPMLHFEMFSGRSSGPLTNFMPPYERRQDLMDPTEYVSHWELKNFGASY